MSGTRRGACCFFRLSFPPISAGIRPTQRNKYRGGASKLEMKKVRLTATRVSVSHYNRFKLRLTVAVIAPWGNIVKFAYDAGLLETRRTASAEISAWYLFIRKTAAISLYPRETAATTLYSWNVRDVSLYIRYETDTRRDFSETRTVQRTDYLL